MFLCPRGTVFVKHVIGRREFIHRTVKFLFDLNVGLNHVVLPRNDPRHLAIRLNVVTPNL
jgi:hypothetical protein